MGTFRKSDNIMTTFNDRLLHNCRHILTPTCQHILTKGKDLCEKERRPFTHVDFPEVNYGTFRNSVSYLLKRELLEDYTSFLAFYWVIGVRKPHDGLGNRKSYGMGVRGRMNDLLELIGSIPLGNRGIHDIRIYFKKEGIYHIIEGAEVVERTLPHSKDLILTEVNIGPFRNAKISVHANDSVSICLGCSTNQFYLTDEGMNDFAFTLGNLGGRIETWCNSKIKVPYVGSWRIKGLHYGRDSLLELSGEKFNITVSELKRTVRVYNKNINGKNKIRMERIDEPDLDVASFIESRINGD